MSLLVCILSIALVWEIQTSNAQSLSADPHWTKEQWSDSDQSFKILRLQIEKSLARKPRNQWLPWITRLRADSNKSPQQVGLFFKWAYATFLYTAETGKRDFKSAAEIQKRFSMDALPKSYEMARLRFLTEARLFASPNLLPLSERLLKRDPKDYDVGYLSINMFNVRDSPQRARAIQLARQLVKIAPNRGSAQASVGWVYFRIWLDTRNPKDAQTSIAAYQRYLQLAPSNDPFRDKVQGLINEMQK